jgi:DNA-binding phage protein
MTKRQFKAQVGHRVGLLMRDLTIDAFAKKCKVDRGKLSQIIKGKGNPTLRTLHRIAVANGLHLQVSFEDSIQPSPPQGKSLKQKKQKRRHE